jgi:hypothetical protein
MGEAKDCRFDGVGLARNDMTRPDEWAGLVSDEDREYLSTSLSADSQRDLHGVLLGCPVALRAAFVAELRQAAGFGDRAVALALARLIDSGRLSYPSELGR